MKILLALSSFPKVVFRYIQFQFTEVRHAAPPDLVVYGTGIHRCYFTCIDRGHYDRTTVPEFVGILPAVAVDDVLSTRIEANGSLDRPECSLAVQRRCIVVPPLDKRLPGHSLRVETVDRGESIPDASRYFVTSGDHGLVLLKIVIITTDWDVLWVIAASTLGVGRSLRADV